MTLIINKKDVTRRDFTRQVSLACAFFIVSPEVLKALKPAGYTEKVPALFQQESPRGIMCLLCPNACVLKENEAGDCRNRVVYKNKLYSIGYGNPCAVNNDPVEKKPLYHFMPGTSALSIATAGCNLACLNCQNWTISQTSPEKTTNYKLPPDDVVATAIANKAASIAYTYSEPNTFYEYVFDTSKAARERGIKNIMVSNGYINPEPLKKLCKVIDAANIDLKSFNDETYMKLNGGKLQPVLDSLRVYRDEGVWLEITNLVVPGWTDKPEEIRAMCKWLYANGFKDTPIHFSRFFPQYKLEHLPPTPVNILRTAAGIAKDEGLNYIYKDNLAGSETSDTFCPKCGKKIISRKGYTIIENNLKNGKCSCGTAIPGVWK
ncbi:MAG TPA: AmmeMemoRadiSam system radical SAM enzyme [Bacteroidales bacterium]|nr:AmmeMemoRadiSam system radical SAM enzyme [Bacteroidales bacterium]HPT11756.1 AmmeMemoRadiSam system radical SAM enzyme [Bacteroidales bacterium]